MKKLYLVTPILLCSCIRMTDYPLDLGNSFYYFNNQVYYSKNGQTVDSVFAERVICFDYNNDYIVLMSDIASVPSHTTENQEGKYVEIFANDTVYSLIDKSERHIITVSGVGAFKAICDSMNVNLNLF